MKRTERHLLAWVCLAYCVFVSWSNCVHSPSIDETAHLSAGVHHFYSGRVELYSVNPPLVRLLATLSVLPCHPKVNWDAYICDPASRPEFPVGRDFVAANGSEAPALYSTARFALLPFYTLGLIATFMLGRIAGGVVVGLFSASFWGLCPLMLGHSSSIAPDVGSAVAGVMVVLLMAQCKSKDIWSWRTVSLLGVSAGYAIGTKLTWLPVLPLVFVIWRIAHPSENETYRFRTLKVLFGIVTAVATVNLLYGFEDSFERLGAYNFHSRLLTVARDEYGTRENRFSGTILEHAPVPFPRIFVQGLDVQKRDFESQLWSYFRGHWRQRGWWNYYLTGFLVKTPVGFQILLYISLLHGVLNCTRWTRESIQKWSLIIAVPLLIFGLVSSQTGFNHHMRYVLPAYPFLFVIAARTVTLGKPWRWLTYCCLSWQLASVLWFAPHWMSYFNELAGGPENGHDWLVDSNIDWGQDILGLKWWQEKHPDIDLQAALFTGFDPKDIGLKYRIAAPYLRGEPTVARETDGLRGPQAGWYAVSVNMLKGMFFSVPDGAGGWIFPRGHFTYFMDHFEPVDMIGYSIYIYHVTEEQAAEVRAKLAAQERLEDLTEARDEEGVEAGPGFRVRK